jgi:xanthine/uracil/vitamin C permease (AzgA family)
MVETSEKPFFETITIMLLATLILAVTLESRQMIRQTRSFAHVFPGENHQLLKKKMLRALDKAYILNVAFIILGAIVLSELFSLTLDSEIFVNSVISILLIALMALPGFLCLMWINVSLSNVCSYCTYLGLVYVSFRWIGDHSEQLWSNPTTYLFAIGCVGLRFLTQSLFYRQPMERLVKNK